MFDNSENRYDHRGLSDIDERVLFFFRPYAVAMLVCWFLSLFCIVYLRNNGRSSSFVLSVLTFIISNLFLIVLYIKTKNIRKRTGE